MNLSSLKSLPNKFLKGFRYGSQPRPMRDWLVLVTVVLVLLTASAGWSYYVFQVTGTDAPQGIAAAISPGPASVSLDSIKQIFDKRAEERAHYLSDYHFVDPSR